MSTKIWINTNDEPWGQDGAIFDDYDVAQRVAAELAANRSTEDDDGSEVAEMLLTLDEIEVENASASEIEDVERVLRALTGAVSPTTMAAVAAKGNTDSRLGPGLPCRPTSAGTPATWHNARREARRNENDRLEQNNPRRNSANQPDSQGRGTPGPIARFVICANGY